ncbi:MAG: hypothetical protein LBT42_07645, partial [Tannerella sp.]|nr:hypothetical protein [Tannerella sp.]
MTIEIDGRHCEERSNPDYTGRWIASFLAMTDTAEMTVTASTMTVTLLRHVDRSAAQWRHPFTDTRDVCSI